MVTLYVLQVLSAVPKTAQRRSPIYLGGTAGMRVLNATDPTAAARIIGNLSEALASTPFDHAGTQGCQMAKFDPFLSLDCARVEGVGAQSKERKGSNFAA